MRILIVSRYKNNFANHILPFVLEQGESLRKQGDAVEYFLIKGNGFASYFLCIGDLKRKIKSFQPDIVHAHYGLSGMAAVMQNKTPVVITFHNGEILSKFVNLITSFFSLRAKHVIYVARHIYDLCYLKAKNYSILPCGVDLDDCEIIDQNVAREKLHFDADKKYVLFGGAFNNVRKNYSLLKEAVSLMGNKDKIVCLEMKGLSRAECVLRMCACDVFVLPTKSEGSPQALKEAMACNCPIVATDVADIKYLLGNEQGHYLITNKSDDTSKWRGDDNSPRELANRLQLAIEYNNRTNGRSRIKSLGLDNKHVAKKLNEIYMSVMMNKE